ncbi:MAG: FAD-dependent pyridine nucleotide-disulfide oxidoreductase [Parcubacteria group bacterium GW2011_GWA2_47_12]|nr:MAG: FAD-dependent pyridine nucleotide-disulfide oxidoreductase [Parcubacteria group bacterium GW2011_GWA2_47_12]
MYNITARKRIVVLGAGFAGLQAAKVLAWFFPRQVILIDKRDYHLFTPELHELDEEKAKLPIKTKAEFIQKEVEDFHNLDYDYLVLATGAKVNYCGIPGLQENALTFYTLEDIKKLRQVPAGEILIIGGGANGVELAAHLAQKLEGEKVKIVEASSQILPDLDESLRKKAQKRLQNLGVEIICSRRLVKVEPGTVFFENGENLKYNNLIWTGGLMMGQYKVDEYLRVIGENNIFAAGSCSSANPGMIRPAMEQAKIVAQNIARTIKGKPLIVYKKRFYGIFVTLGDYYALGKIGRIKMSGFLTWLIKKIIKFLYKKSYV